MSESSPMAPPADKADEPDAEEKDKDDAAHEDAAEDKQPDGDEGAGEGDASEAGEAPEDEAQEDEALEDGPKTPPPDAAEALERMKREIDFAEPRGPPPEAFDDHVAEPLRVAPGSKLLPGRRVDHFSKLHKDHERKIKAITGVREFLDQQAQETEKAERAKFLKKAPLEETDRIVTRLHAHHEQKQQIFKGLREAQEQETKSMAAKTCQRGDPGKGKVRATRLYENRFEKKQRLEALQEKHREMELNYMKANSVHGNLEKSDEALQNACERLYAQHHKQALRAEQRRKENEAYEQKKFAEESVHRDVDISWRTVVNRLNQSIERHVRRREEHLEKQREADEKHLEQQREAARPTSNARPQRTRKIGVDTKPGDERFHLLYSDSFRRKADRKVAIERHETVQHRRRMLVSVHAAAQTHPWSKDEVANVFDRMHRPPKSNTFFNTIAQDTFAASVGHQSEDGLQFYSETGFDRVNDITESDGELTEFSLGDIDSARDEPSLHRSASQPNSARGEAATPPRRKARRQIWAEKVEHASAKVRQTIQDVGEVLRQDTYDITESDKQAVFRFQHRSPGDGTFFTPAFPSFSPGVNFEESSNVRPSAVRSPSPESAESFGSRSPASSRRDESPASRRDRSPASPRDRSPASPRDRSPDRSLTASGSTASIASPAMSRTMSGKANSSRSASPVMNRALNFLESKENSSRKANTMEKNHLEKLRIVLRELEDHMCKDSFKDTRSDATASPKKKEKKDKKDSAKKKKAPKKPKASDQAPEAGAKKAPKKDAAKAPKKASPAQAKAKARPKG